MCKKEKHSKDFYKKYADCEKCNTKRVLKLYSNTNIECCNGNKDKYVHSDKIVTTYVELDNRL